MQSQELQFESILQNSPINAFKEVSNNASFANVRAFRRYVSHSISSTKCYHKLLYFQNSTSQLLQSVFRHSLLSSAALVNNM